MKYRIIQRRDTVLEIDYFYIETKEYFWSSWRTRFPSYSNKFTTLKAAQDEVQNLKDNTIIHYDC